MKLYIVYVLYSTIPKIHHKLHILFHIPHASLHIAHDMYATSLILHILFYQMTVENVFSNVTSMEYIQQVAKIILKYNFNSNVNCEWIFTLHASISNLQTALIFPTCVMQSHSCDGTTFFLVYVYSRMLYQTVSLLWVAVSEDSLSSCRLSSAAWWPWTEVPLSSPHATSWNTTADWCSLYPRKVASCPNTSQLLTHSWTGPKLVSGMKMQKTFPGTWENLAASS